MLNAINMIKIRYIVGGKNKKDMPASNPALKI
jgi:hypothetical protein